MSEDTAFEIGRLYPPIKAIADTLVASQKDIFVRLPGLVGYYPGGIRNQSGNLSEHSGNAYTLLQTGVCPVGYDGNAFSHLGNGTNYLHAAAIFPITGLETWITSSMRGLTIGGWFMVDSTPASLAGIISKWAPSPDRGYALEWVSSNVARFAMSSNGAAAFFVDSSASPISTWTFLVGRFIPSTEIAVFANGDKSVNTTAIPASVNVSTQDFEIGRIDGDNALIFHGKARDVFICAAALSDALIEEIRVTSAP